MKLDGDKRVKARKREEGRKKKKEMEKKGKEELAARSIRHSQTYRVCKIPGRSEFTSNALTHT